MDPVMTALLNFGGTGILAAALLLLHRDAIKAFQEEQKLERQMCRENNRELCQTLVQEMKENHQEMSVRLESMGRRR